MWSWILDSALVLTTGADVEGDQPSAAAQATSVVAVDELVDPMPSELLDLVVHDVLLSKSRCVRS